MKNYPKIIAEFQQYVLDFYNSTDGVYPIATKELIEQSVNQYLESKPLSQIYFDSFDREEVRCIIEPSHSIFIPK